MTEKKKLLVSFSGGETSAYMAQWLWNNKQDEYEMIFVFANTGEENEETLQFVQRCSEHFGFPVVWVEAVVNPAYREGTTHRGVGLANASRSGEPFASMIAKYGIPNIDMPHCTRELKERPITDYARSIGWKDYYTAIGIRIDEFDRMNAKKDAMNLVYPLVTMRPMDKPRINFWWSRQEFRLNLKGYEGNCKWCWKKSYSKLRQIAKDAPERFDFPLKMEAEYGTYISPERKKKHKDEGREITLPVVFFRNRRSAKDILEASKTFSGAVADDSQDTNIQTDLFEETESCEVFTQCGSQANEDAA